MWTALKAGVRRLMRRSETDRELDDEVRHFIDEQTEEYVRDGMSRDEARRLASVSFGGATTVKQRVREAGWDARLHTLTQDVRYGARTMRRNPGFTVVAVLTIALGVGVNSAMFSLVDSLMLRTLPVHRPSELVTLTMGPGDEVFTNPIWEAIRDRQDVFAGAFATAVQSFDLSNGGETRRTLGSYVSGEFFSTLGIAPVAGRLLTRSDDFRGCPAVAVVGSGFWERELGGVPGGALGPATVSVNGRTFDVVGVAPPSFTGVIPGLGVDIFVPLCAEALVRGPQSTLDQRADWWLRVMARVRPGVSLAQVQARLTTMSPQVFAQSVPTDFAAESQQRFLERQLVVASSPGGIGSIRDQYEKPLLVLMSAAVVVLLIACANVANLLLARASARSREIAIRVAVGAARSRLVRQLLTESLLLALAGAALGVALAYASSGALIALLSSSGTPITLDLSPNLRLLGYAVAIATATGLAFGMAPAWRASRVDPNDAMKSGTRVVGGSGQGSRSGLRSSFVVVQLALSLVLVMAAALLLDTFRSLSTMDPGFRQDGVLLVRVDPRKAQFSEERERAVRQELLAELRALPGVRSASASLLTPVSGRGWNNPVSIDGYKPSNPKDAMAFFNEVSDGYLATLQIGLVAGREFGPQDLRNGPRVAIINEAMARKFFPGTSPIGKHFRMLSPVQETASPPEYEIIGVSRDAKYQSLRETIRPAALLPLSQSKYKGTTFTYALRSDLPRNALVPLVTKTITSINPALALDYATLSAQLSGSLMRERVLATLATAFGTLALLLAAVGVYGTIAYRVARRRNEIGIRLALGAERGHVLRMVLGESGRMAAVGVVIGVAASYGATRAISSFLYGVAPHDAGLIALSAITLVVVALAAGLVPAWRAARTDPLSTLREQ